MTKNKNNNINQNLGIKLVKHANGIDRNSTWNEFYTTAETAEELLRPLLYKFDGLKVCCPCDGDTSEIVKWLKNNSTCEIDYFADLDINSEEARTRMSEADFIITNPPFSARFFNPFFKWLVTNKKDFIIFAATLALDPRRAILSSHVYPWQPVRAVNRYFKRPDGTLKYVSIVYLLSFKPPYYVEWGRTRKILYGNNSFIVPITALTKLDIDEWKIEPFLEEHKFPQYKITKK